MHPGGAGRPHRERGAGHPLVLHQAGAQPVPQAQVRALADQVQVQLAERGREAIRVLGLPLVLPRADPQPVTGQVGHRHHGFEEPGRVRLPHRRGASRVGHGDLVGLRLEGADGGGAVFSVGAEQVVRVAEAPLDQQTNLRPGLRPRGHSVPRVRNRSGMGAQAGRWSSS